MLKWKKRCIKKESATLSQRKWETFCGKYVVSECKSHLRKNDKGKPRVYWLAIIRNDIGNEWILSEHRKKHKAYESCESHYLKNEKPLAKKTKNKNSSLRKR